MLRLSLALQAQRDPPVNWAKEYTTAFSVAELRTYIPSLSLPKSANRSFHAQRCTDLGAIPYLVTQARNIRMHRSGPPIASSEIIPVRIPVRNSLVKDQTESNILQRQEHLLLTCSPALLCHLQFKLLNLYIKIKMKMSAIKTVDTKTVALRCALSPLFSSFSIRAIQTGTFFSSIKIVS